MQLLTWGELIMYTIVGAGIWYGFVLVMYYRKEIAGRLFSKSDSGPAKWVREPVTSIEPSKVGNPRNDAANDAHAQVHELMQELRLVFDAAVKDTLQEEQVMEAIAIRLKRYLILPDHLRSAINQHLSNEFSLQLQITIAENQINTLWQR